MKKIIFLFSLFYLMSFSIFSQEKEGKPSAFLLTLGPIGVLNTHVDSAPSPILFSIGAGAQVEIVQGMSFTPHAHFFGSYYLWKDGAAYPAEIEHRSAYVPSIMLDIPFTGDIHFKNSVLRIGAGMSFLLRFALLARNVPGSVQGDIENMNNWFWKDLEFLYPSTQFSWDYIFNNGFAFGMGAKIYIPLGSLLKGNGLQNSMTSISFRIIPPVLK